MASGDVSVAWRNLGTRFENAGSGEENGEVSSSVDAIVAANQSAFLYEWTAMQMSSAVKERTCPAFGQLLTTIEAFLEDSLEIALINDITRQLAELSKQVSRLQGLANDIDRRAKANGRRGLGERYRDTLKSELVRCAPAERLDDCLTKLLGRMLHVHALTLPFDGWEKSDEEDEQEEGQDEHDVALSHTHTPSRTCTVCQQLHNVCVGIVATMGQLGLGDRVSDAPLASVVYQAVEKMVLKRCKGRFDAHFLSTVEDWVRDIVLPFVDSVLVPRQGYNGEQLLSPRTSAQSARIEFFAYKTLVDLRITEMFDIILDCEESEPALNDLQVALTRTDSMPQLLASLREVINHRLLHAGANTADIITFYMSAIKALRILDPSQVSLHTVCSSIQAFLREREDTIRCVVTNLVSEDASNDLFGPPEEEGELLDEDMSGDESMAGPNALEWEPEPADSTLSSHVRKRASDIIGVMVHIYGSKEVFVNEYRALLAERLLSALDFETEREVRNVELLKKRFGETGMHHCEVMLKDVVDSKRISSNIRDNYRHTAKKEIPLDVTCVSRLYWPALKEETFAMPPLVKSWMDKYVELYTQLKAARTLEYKPYYGKVTLTLTLKDRTLDFTVPAFLAAIISCFDGEERRSLDDIATALEAPVSDVRQRIGWWIAQEVLEECSPGVYQVIEERHSAQTRRPAIYHDMDDEHDGGDDGDHGDAVAALWPFIEGMLTNLGSMPVERIHSMLGMFSGGAVPPIDHIKAYLDEQVAEDVLEYSLGEYRLRK